MGIREYAEISSFFLRAGGFAVVPKLQFPTTVYAKLCGWVGEASRAAGTRRRDGRDGHAMSHKIEWGTKNEKSAAAGREKDDDGDGDDG